jgi:hypothetical protein
MGENLGGLKIAYVRWFDASFQRGECTDDELVPRVEIESAGLLVREDEGTISIALDRYEHDGLWRYIQHIPKVNVISVERLTAGCLLGVPSDQESPCQSYISGWTPVSQAGLPASATPVQPQ